MSGMNRMTRRRLAGKTRKELENYLVGLDTIIFGEFGLVKRMDSFQKDFLNLLTQLRQAKVIGQVIKRTAGGIDLPDGVEVPSDVGTPGATGIRPAVPSTK